MFSDTIYIEINNISQIPVDMLSLHVDEELSMKPKFWEKNHSIFSWEKDSETEQINKEPLLPTKKLRFPIQVNGLPG